MSLADFLLDSLTNPLPKPLSGNGVGFSRSSDDDSGAND